MHQASSPSLCVSGLWDAQSALLWCPRAPRGSSWTSTLFHSFHCHLQGQAASSSVDPESLERQNDQNIGSLGDRVSLLRQVSWELYCKAQDHGW